MTQSHNADRAHEALVYRCDEMERELNRLRETPAKRHCSIAPKVPMLPDDAIEFAKAVAALVERYAIDKVTMDVEVRTGYGTKYHANPDFKDRVVEKMRVGVSVRDGRGRPRTQIYVQADMHVRVPIVWEPDTS